MKGGRNRSISVCRSQEEKRKGRNEDEHDRMSLDTWENLPLWQRHTSPLSNLLWEIFKDTEDAASCDQGSIDLSRVVDSLRHLSNSSRLSHLFKRDD